MSTEKSDNAGVSGSSRSALVTGAYGICGLNVVEQLDKSGGWSITGIGRRATSPNKGVGYMQVDLENAEETMRALSNRSDITHLFFGAFRYVPDPYEEIDINVRMLENTLDALRAAKAPLERVVIYQGSKAYGALLGPMKTPSYERDPRVPGPLFYWDQQDLLFERGAEDGFGTTVLRPDFIIGIGLGSYTALFNSIAVYATVCKMQNLPLRYPGGLVGYNQLFQMTDAALLARASEWACSRPHRENEIFNVTNGDLIRLCNVWPRIAEYFELDLAPPLDINLELFMRDKAESWNALGKEQGLEVSFEELVDWNRNARVFTLPTEIHTSTVKIRKAGFEECLDSEDRLFELFDEMRERRYIPTL